ncbi:hypothetical protein LIS77_13765 [Cytobacillus firmus]|nr:hypothetical protein LIS77_13765 [Cytobacillus firmus]
MATVTTGFTISLAFGVPIGTLTAAYIDWHYIYLIIAGLTLIKFALIKQISSQIRSGKINSTEKTIISNKGQEGYNRTFNKSILDIGIHLGLCIYFAGL